MTGATCDAHIRCRYMYGKRLDRFVREGMNVILSYRQIGWTDYVRAKVTTYPATSGVREPHQTPCVSAI